MSVNTCIFVGNCAEPEIISAESGTIAKFSLAINESYKNKQGEKVEQTEWVNVVCFGNIAEIVEKYVKKGQQLYVNGAMKTKSYTDKEGNKRYSTAIELNNFYGKLEMLGKKDSASIPPPHSDDETPFN